MVSRESSVHSRSIIEKKGLKKGDQVVYYGVPGTCTPFVELLGFAVRSLELEQVFVPMVDESKAHRIQNVPDIGMQAGAAMVNLKPKAIVIMGGLSMPNVPVKAEQVKAVIDRHPAHWSSGSVSCICLKKPGGLQRCRSTA